jgi:hypothetical protein
VIKGVGQRLSVNHGATLQETCLPRSSR